MANNKKFIVKNGLITPESVIAGTELDNGTDTLQISGSSTLLGEVNIASIIPGIPTLDVVNTGATDAIVARFRGESASLEIKNLSEGDYSLLNTGQDNGIVFYDDTTGLELVYGNSARLSINSTGNNFTGNSTIDGNRILTTADEGSGNGLDADTIDGIDSSQFLRNDQDGTLDGNFVVTGDFTVNGTTTTVNTETVLIADNIITLNSDETGTPSQNSGIEIERGTSANVSLIWNETSDHWEISGTGRIITTADEGSGNGFDADTVDGIEASQFLRSDQNDTTTGSLTVEGDLIVGDDVGSANINFNNAGQNRQISSQNSDIGFLMPNFNFGAFSTASGDWVVARDNISTANTVSQADIIAWNDISANNNISSGNDISATNNISAGQDIQATNNVTAGNDVIATGDVTGENLSSTNDINAGNDITATGDVTGENLFAVNDATVGGTLFANDIVTEEDITANNIFASRFVDSDDISFYGDFAGISQFNGVDIQGRIRSIDDLNTYLEFPSADTFEVTTNGITRLTVNNISIESDVNMVAPRFVDGNNSTYYGDFAGTSIVNDINLDGQISSVGDPNTYIEFNSSDTFRIVTGASARLTVNNVSVVSSVDVFAPIYYDNNDTSFYGNFAETSVMNIINANTLNVDDINLGNRITSEGDANTYLEFDSEDSFRIVTGASARLTVDNNSVRSSVDIFAPRFLDSEDNSYLVDPSGLSIMDSLNIDDKIYHNGDVTTYLDFATTESFDFVTAGVSKLTINNSNVTSTVDVIAPRFVDSADSTYFLDPFSTSVLNRINLVGAIRNSGDADTLIQFPTTGQIGFNTNGTNRLLIEDSIISSSVDLHSTRFVDLNNTAYYADFGNATTSISALGKVVIGAGDEIRRDDNTGNGGVTIASFASENATNNPFLSVSGGNGSRSLAYLNRIDIGTNPSLASNRYMEFINDGINSVSFSGDQFNNFYTVMDSGDYGIYNSGFDALLVVQNDGTIVVGDSSALYSISDATPIVGTNTNNILNVNGSIQLNDNNDAIVFGRGTSSFLKHNELSFGLGGGLHMTESGTLRISNDVKLRTTVDIEAARFVDVNDGSFLIDPAGTSRVNLIDLAGRIRHDGDTDTDIRFGADRFSVVTGGSERLIVENSLVTSTVELRAPQLVDRDDTAFFVNPSGASNFRNLNVLSGDATAQLSVGRDSGQKIQLLVEDGPGYLRYIQDEGGNFNHSFNFEIVSPANQESSSFNFNRTINVVGDFNTDGDVSTEGSITADEFIDGNVAGYSIIPSDVSRFNIINLDDQIRHQGDEDTYLQFNTANSWRVVTGGSQRLVITNTSATFANDIIGPIFRDSSDPNNRYVNPGNDTQINQLIAFGSSSFRSVGTPLRVYSTGTGNTNSNTGIGLEAYAPDLGTSTTGAGISFHRAGSYAINMGLDSDNVFRIGGWSAPDNLLVINTSGAVTALDSLNAPVFQDSQDTSYFVDPNGSSLLATLRVVNQIGVGSETTTFIAPPTGSYGSIKVEGESNGWAGYAIRDNWIFMANGAERAGIYNDTDNEWSLQIYRNGGVDLYHNGTVEFQTAGGYAQASTALRAPIFQDTSSTSRFLSPNAGNGNVALSITGEIERVGFATGAGSDNYILKSEDRNQWIWASGGSYNWGIFWASENNPAYSHFGGTNPDELVFVGGGTTRSSIDLSNGDAWFDGNLTASSVSLDAGDGEAILFNPAYGSGGADLVLFDATTYFESRTTQANAPNENNLTNDKSEYSKTTEGPFAGAFVLRTNQYRNFYSDFIPVAPGEELYGEISIKYISGSGGITYYGVERYDSERRAITSNAGMTYFVTSGSNDTNPNWVTRRGSTILPTTHTPYQGSDGGGVYYVRIRVLLNYSSEGALREFGGIMLKRRNAESSLTVDDLLVMDDLNVDGDLTTSGTIISNSGINAPIFRDTADTNFYVDPANTSRSGRLRGDILIGSNSSGYSLQVGGDGREFQNNTTTGSIAMTSNLHMDSASGRNTYINYYDGDSLYIGTGNGSSHSRWRNDGALNIGSDAVSSYFLNVEGTVRSSGDMRAPRYIDDNDPTYYVNPAGTSELNEILVGGRSIRLSRMSGGRGSLNINGGQVGSYEGYVINNRVSFLHNNGTVAGLYNDVNNQWLLYADFNSRLRLFYAGVQQASTESGYFLAQNQMRAPIYYDSDDTQYQVNPNSTSQLNDVRANIFRDRADANFYLNATSSQWQVNTPSGYVRIGPANSGFTHYNTDRPLHYFGQPVQVNGDIKIYQSLARMSGDQMYATRFNDANNTSYYIDPDSTSVLNTLDLRGRLLVADVENYDATTVNALTDAPISTRNIDYRIGTTDTFLPLTYQTARNQSGYRTHLSTGLLKNAGNSWNENGWFMAIGGSDSSPTEYMTLEYGGFINSSLGQVRTSSSFDANQFRDLNNTLFYLDPASSSNLFEVNVGRLEVNNSGGDSVLKFGPGLPANDDAHIEWKGSSNAGYLRFSTSDDNGSEYMQFGDYDNTNRGGTFTEWAKMDRNLFYHTSDIRAPVFYDLDNTGFYTNAASTSNMNIVNANEFYANNWFRNINNGEGMLNEQNNTRFYSDGTSRYTMWSATNSSQILFRSNSGTPRGWVNATSNNDVGFLNDSGAWRARIVGGDYMQFDGSSIRARRLYDLDNTTYYVDPASVSTMNTIDLEGTIRHDGDANTYIQFHEQDQFRVVTGGVQQLEVNNNRVTANNIMVAGSFETSGALTVGIGATSSNIYMRDTDNTDRRIHCNSSRIGFLSSSDNWGSYSTNGGDWFSDQSVRSPIFYDSNNTGFRVDPTGTTVLSAATFSGNTTFSGGAPLRVNSTGTGNVSTNGQIGLEIYGASGGGGAGMSFHRGGSFAINMGLDSNNVFKLGGWSANDNLMTINTSGSMSVIGDFRAPIFYDSNNTGFRLDPNGTSNLETVDVTTLNTSGLITMERATSTVLRLRNTVNAGKVTIQMTDNQFGGQSGNFSYVHSDSASFGGSAAFLFEGNQPTTNLVCNGGNIIATGDVTAFYSDERLKNFEGKIDNALDKISKMNGYYYKGNDVAKSLGYNNEERQVGVNAQEVQKVMPEVVVKAPVSYRDDVDEDYLTVHYDKLVPVLIEGIKEQQTQIEDQQKQIDELKEMVKLLMNK